MIPASSSDGAHSKDKALDLVNHWIDAVNRHDLEAIVRLFAHDASFFGTSTQTLLHSFEEIRKYFDVVLASYTPLSVELGQVTVSELSPDSAVVTGYDQWKITMDGKPEDGKGRLSIAIALRDGQWRIISFHRSAIPS